MFQLIFFAYCIQWCKLYEIISGSHLVTGERELNEQGLFYNPFAPNTPVGRGRTAGGV